MGQAAILFEDGRLDLRVAANVSATLRRQDDRPIDVIVENVSASGRLVVT
jgi:hypothetical protein